MLIQARPIWSRAVTAAPIWIKRNRTADPPTSLNSRHHWLFRWPGMQFDSRRLHYAALRPFGDGGFLRAAGPEGPGFDSAKPRRSSPSSGAGRHSLPASLRWSTPGLHWRDPVGTSLRGFRFFGRDGWRWACVATISSLTIMPRPEGAGCVRIADVERELVNLGNGHSDPNLSGTGPGHRSRFGTDRLIRGHRAEGPSPSPSKRPGFSGGGPRGLRRSSSAASGSPNLLPVSPAGETSPTIAGSIPGTNTRHRSTS